MAMTSEEKEADYLKDNKLEGRETCMCSIKHVCKSCLGNSESSFAF